MTLFALISCKDEVSTNREVETPQNEPTVETPSTQLKETQTIHTPQLPNVPDKAEPSISTTPGSTVSAPKKEIVPVSAVDKPSIYNHWKLKDDEIILELRYNPLGFTEFFQTCTGTQNKEQFVTLSGRAQIDSAKEEIAFQIVKPEFKSHSGIDSSICSKKLSGSFPYFLTDKSLQIGSLKFLLE